MSLHWFFDDIPDDYRSFRQHAQAVEKDYLELRNLLQKAENALQQDPASVRLQARVAYLRKRLADLETQAPWLTYEVLHEVALWGCPH